MLVPMVLWVSSASSSSQKALLLDPFQAGGGGHIGASNGAQGAMLPQHSPMKNVCHSLVEDTGPVT